MFLVYGGDEELVVKGYVDARFDTDLKGSDPLTKTSLTSNMIKHKTH